MIAPIVAGLAGLALIVSRRKSPGTTWESLRNWAVDPAARAAATGGVLSVKYTPGGAVFSLQEVFSVAYQERLYSYLPTEGLDKSPYAFVAVDNVPRNGWTLYLDPTKDKLPLPTQATGAATVVPPPAQVFLPTIPVPGSTVPGSPPLAPSAPNVITLPNMAGGPPLQIPVPAGFQFPAGFQVPGFPSASPPPSPPASPSPPPPTGPAPAAPSPAPGQPGFAMPASIQIPNPQGGPPITIQNPFFQGAAPAPPAPPAPAPPAPPGPGSTNPNTGQPLPGTPGTIKIPNPLGGGLPDIEVPNPLGPLPGQPGGAPLPGQAPVPPLGNLGFLSPATQAAVLNQHGKLGGVYNIRSLKVSSPAEAIPLESAAVEEYNQQRALATSHGGTPFLVREGNIPYKVAEDYGGSLGELRAANLGRNLDSQWVVNSTWLLPLSWDAESKPLSRVRKL